MKKFTIILTILIAMTIKSNAQIPNNGFENWTSGNPNGWVSCNGNGNGTPVTQSSDHYPTNVGTSSVRMENYSPGATTGCSPLGLVNTGFYIGYNGPSFPITGHPNSFSGYYKFLPQNNDTMTIACALYLNGAMVAFAILTTTNTVSNWTSFTIPFSSYITADSASVGFSAFYSLQYTAAQGNSILYVDNLSFDNLITSVTEQTSKNEAFSLYPNPASDVFSLTLYNTDNADLTLNIYNVIGTLVKSETLKQNQQQINIGDLSNGVYMVVIKSKEWTEKQKLIIQR